MKGKILATLAGAVALSASVNAANLYFYDSNDKLVYFADETEISKVAYDANGAVVVYDASGNAVSASGIAYMTDAYTIPTGTILDISFNQDGSATDKSSFAKSVTTVGNPDVRYSDIFGCYVANFNNTWGNDPSNYYRIDYASDEAFKEALYNGHTLEALVMADYDGEIPNREAKCFASHEQGGTGLMVCKTGNGSQGLNELTFLPNVTTSGSSTWRWATSGVTPVKQTYYHLVGVWDAEADKARIYVNGELLNEADAQGDFRPAKSGCLWFAIGGDAGSGKANNGWKGDVVYARVYDQALTTVEAEGLWAQVAEATEIASKHLVEGVTFYSLPVKANIEYPIFGDGFLAGDKVLLTKGNAEYEVDLKFADDKNTITIPAALESGDYRFTLVRGNDKQLLGTATLTVVESVSAPAEIIAHRGFWNTEGAAQNSRAAVEKALEQDFYGAEIDVYVTADDHVVLSHDISYGGYNLSISKFDEIKNLTLSNGETLPELSEVLDIIAKSTSRTKLVIEIKEHNNATNNERCAKAAVAAVKAAGVEDKVEYISFNNDILKAVLLEDPEAYCAYLGSNCAPAYLQHLGHKAIDFTYSTYKSSPDYIVNAHNLGMKVYTWTINNIEDIIDTYNDDYDAIATDYPMEAKALYEYYNSFK